MKTPPSFFSPGVTAVFLTCERERFFFYTGQESGARGTGSFIRSERAWRSMCGGSGKRYQSRAAGCGGRAGEDAVVASEQNIYRERK
jgi:hypothetical protein